MKNYKNIKKQEGVALAIGIILLLVIAVIGVTSMKSALLQEKMAGGLARKGFADTAAYTLLVNVENYVFRQYQTNNGVNSAECLYCGDSFEIRGSDWHSFISDKSMGLGSMYTGTNSLKTTLKGNLKDEPRFLIYPINNYLTDGNGVAIQNTVGEEGGGSAASSSGSLGGSKDEQKMFYYKIGTKANDSTGNIFVVYQSVFAMRQN
ncbi:MAG: PilX N-terminal domain-containing pilus assembly protein [Marinicellaceae bacterium]